MEIVEQPTRVKDVVSSTLLCSMLNSSNYMVWSVRMKINLKAHDVWDSIDPGCTNPKKNNFTIALLFQAIPETLVIQFAELNSPKLIWEAIKTRHLGADRVRAARLQTLVSEFERLKMKESDMIDSFAGKISKFASKSCALGQNMDEPKLVKKFLSSLPENKFIHIVASLEQVLDLDNTSFEKDIVGRLKAYDERIRNKENNEETQGQLLFSNSKPHRNKPNFAKDKGQGKVVLKEKGKLRCDQTL